MSALLTREAPTLKRCDTQVPSKLVRIVHRCLEKEPDRRYQSALELVMDLKNLNRDSDSGSDRRRMTSQVRAPSRRRKSINSIAVLPMTNANDDPGAEYLSDGITESLINSLSQLPKLKVMARSTVFRYKSKLDDPRQVGNSLGVEAVLVGRVILRGDKLITSAELVDVADGATLWGGRFNSGLADIFSIQEEISSEITAGLRLRLTGEERKRLTRRYTENTKAYQLYLKGRFFWNRRTEEGLRKGIEHFRLAIEEDPAYALAYAGLADCYNMLCWWNLVAPEEEFPKAKAAALKAIELDATLAEAHASAGGISETDWDWKTAEQEYKRALELNPNYALTHQWYGEFLAHTGQFDQALSEMKLAERLDPLSNIINTEVGWILFLLGEYDSAIKHCRAAVELDPKFAAAHWRLSEVYLQKKMFDTAIREIKRAIELSGSSLQMVARLAHAYAVSGKRGRALEVLNELNESAKIRYVSPYDIAIIYAGLSEKEMALAWLERGYRERTVGLTFLKVEPAFNSLRDDPRLTDLLRRVGLSDV
jgi:TolB-like protein/Tfp pilus assembly protein PilF